MDSRPVIFDLFHTLVDPDDFRPSGFRRLEAAAAVLGVAYRDFEEEWNRSLPELVRGGDSVRGLLRRLAKRHGLPARTLDIAPAAEPLGRYQDLALLHPRRAIVELLDGLNGRPRALLTNCHDRDIEAWRGSPLARRIEHPVFSVKARAAKPDMAAYRAVLDSLATAAADTIYVGNGGDEELAGASAAGIGLVVHFAAFDDRRRRVDAGERERRAAQAHVTVGSLEELAQVVGV